MAATPYKIALTIRNPQGVKSLPMTASDVNAAFWLYPSGGNELQLSSLPCVISDIIYTAAGVDTTSVDLFVNGVNTGVRIFNGLNLATTINRQIASSPLSIPGGALVKFTQNT